MTEPWWAYVIMLVAFTGTVFTIRKSRVCWLVWSLSNGGAIVYFLAEGLNTQACVAAVNLVMCLVGWRAWRPAAGRRTPCRRSVPAGMVAARDGTLFSLCSAGRRGYQPKATDPAFVAHPPSEKGNAT